MATETKSLEELKILQKAKNFRRIILLLTIIIIATIAIFFGRTFNGKFLGVELNVGGQESITEQVKQETKNSTLDIPFTVGKIDEKASAAILKQKEKINQNGFTGRNYINYDFGFLFEVKNPTNWNLTYNPSKWNQPLSMLESAVVNIDDPNNTFRFRIVGVDNPQNESIEKFVNDFTTSFTVLSGITPKVNYNKGANVDVAFFEAENTETGVSTLVKAVLANQKCYVGFLYYYTAQANEPKILELKGMLSTLTLLSIDERSIQVQQ